jgi:hypothetical protein
MGSKDQGGAIPVLDGDGVGRRAQWPAFGIDQGVNLAPLYRYHYECRILYPRRANREGSA